MGLRRFPAGHTIRFRLILFLLAWSAAYGAVLPAWAFRIETPTEGAALLAGQSLDVAVDLGSELGVSRVLYYWYRMGEEPVVAQQANLALAATSAATPPFGGRVTVPNGMLGTMRLLAVGEVTRGRLAGQEEFDEILVRVDPPVALTGIEFEVEKPWRLDTIGKILEVPVVGQFADGATRWIGGASSGSSYESSNEQVIAVLPGGFVRVEGKGKAVLTVNNRGREGRLEVSVNSEAEPNGAPTAQAGPDQTVKAGTTVALGALQSRDPDGDPLRYEWSQVRGNKVSLLDADSAKATFVAPKVSARRLFRFKLRVTDMKGPDTVKGADSLPSFVNVWVIP
ncbi:MAG: hypothetical protein KGO52_01070 [Nitrospirota bacterium]|nr:hypothetical protein [Nitrospirota bacterium]MDE3241293.1 hypothetical protein [Nitrospirota bacterium]